MTAHEDQSDRVVIREVAIVHLGVQALFHDGLTGVHQQRQLLAVGGRAPLGVEHSPTRDRREPRSRIVGNAVAGPARHRLGEGVLGRFFREVNVPRRAHRRGEYPRPLIAVGVRHGRAHVVGHLGVRAGGNDQELNRTYFDAATLMEDGVTPGDGERGVKVGRVDYAHAENDFL